MKMKNLLKKFWEHICSNCEMYIFGLVVISILVSTLFFNIMLVGAITTIIMVIIFGYLTYMNLFKNKSTYDSCCCDLFKPNIGVGNYSDITSESSQYKFVNKFTDVEHTVSIFYDYGSESYKIVDVKNKEIWSNSFESQDKALEHIVEICDGYIQNV